MLLYVLIRTAVYHILSHPVVLKHSRKISIKFLCSTTQFNPSNAKLNPICQLLALLGAHHILHVSRMRLNNWRCTVLRVSSSKESSLGISDEAFKTRYFFMFFLDIHTELDTCSYELFFSLTNINTITSQSLTFPPESPCMCNTNLGPVFCEISKEV